MLDLDIYPFSQQNSETGPFQPVHIRRGQNHQFFRRFPVQNSNGVVRIWSPGRVNLRSVQFAVERIRKALLEPILGPCTEFGVNIAFERRISSEMYVQ